MSALHPQLPIPLRAVLRCAGRAITAIAVLLWTGPALAHVSSEQAFVLLLPTDIYLAAGVAAVALTVVLLGVLPDRWTLGLFRTFAATGITRPRLQVLTSTVSFLVLAAAVGTGFFGPHNPLINPLSLLIWTIWFVALLPLFAVFGDLWQWINPWTGPYRLLSPLFGVSRPLKLPSRLDLWPGVALYIAFACFYLADLAPDDPGRLATVITVYWLVSLVAMILFGEREWLDRGEFTSMLASNYATVSPFRRGSQTLSLGLPGHRIVTAPALTVGGAVFVTSILATGSFDGLNETFWWLDNIGINPLDYPGRSGVFWSNVGGLIGANILLALIFTLCVWLGLRLAGGGVPFGEALGRFAHAIMPIAVGYHVAHYLTALLVNGQYVLVAVNDPLESGANLLGFTNAHVTTGFFNTRDTVRAIFLTQAGAIVVGHMLAVIVSHAIALQLFGNSRRALLSQVPIAVLMIAYTLFGLWLLATARGG